MPARRADDGAPPFIRPASATLAATRHARLYAADGENRPALLKVATEDTMADPLGRARFAREGRVGLALRHPHLARTLRCGENWILLEDLRGQGGRAASLDDRVRERGPLAPAAVAHLVAALAAALAHMHGRGLVHRDVKPGNILFAPTGDRPVLIDFGAVGLSVGDDLDGAELIGSPAWMAPEQVDGCPAQAGADAWSLAAVATYALYGRPLFAGTASDVLRCRGHGAGIPPDLLRNVRSRCDARLAELILSGLAVEPAARPAMAAFARLDPEGPA